MSGTVDDLYYLLLGNSETLRARPPTAAERNPLLPLEQRALPSYQIPLRRAGEGDAFWYPGFGVDPERLPGAVPGAPPPGAPAPASAPPSLPSPGIVSATMPAGATGGGGGVDGLDIAGLLLPLALRGVPAAIRALQSLGQSGLPADLDADLAYLRGEDWGTSDEPPAALDEGSPDFEVGAGLPADLDADLDFLRGNDGAGTATEPPALLDEGSPAFDQPMPVDTGSDGNFFGADGLDDIGGSPDFAAGVLSGGPRDLLTAGFPNAGGWEGFGTDLGRELFPQGLPQVGAPLGSVDVLGFTINPAGIGAGAIGGYAGTTLARNLVRGDAEDQRTASSIGGTIGGALGGLGGAAALGGLLGSWAGPAGILIGAFIGSLASGTLFAGSPDLPYAAVAGDFNMAGDGVRFGISDAAAGAGGDARAATDLGAFLNDYITRTAGERGLVVDPAMVNTGGFFAGSYDGDLFYRPAGSVDDLRSGIRPAEAAWRGDSRDDLARFAFDDLTSRGFFTTPDKATPFETVRSAIGPTGTEGGGPLVGIGREAPVQLEQPYRISFNRETGGTRGPVGTAYTDPESGVVSYIGGRGPEFTPQPAESAQQEGGSPSGPANEPMRDLSPVEQTLANYAGAP